MNSITKYLTPATIAATLLAMRSGRKEIFLVVEGDSDVDLLSQIFCLGHSNFVACSGKENLNAVYELSPRKGLDQGTVFLRDRDHESLSHSDRGGTKLYVTDYYDIEMQLLSTRIFGRIFREYKKGETTDSLLETNFNLIANAAAWIGALRLYNTRYGIGIDFDDIKFNRFLDVKSMTVDPSNLVKYMLAKSQLSHAYNPDLEVEVAAIYKSNEDKKWLVCGKDFIDILHVAFHRHFKFCDSSECEPVVLLRMLRAAAVIDDLKNCSFFSLFAAHISSCEFCWAGCQLEG